MASLSHALDVQKQLFDRYDRLNSLWEQAEKQLIALHVPRPVRHAYLSYPMSENSSAYLNHCLGLQKIKGSWRICYAVDYDYNRADREPDWTPISECSATIRVHAAPHLPGLRSAALASSEKFIPEVDKAIDELAKGIAEAGDPADRFKMNGKAR
jgi:hypothetical protein